MKRSISLITLILLPGIGLSGQFEQKLSLNLSAGIHKTLGARDYLPEGSMASDAYEPELMSNFKTGASVATGLQYNFNRHLSIGISFGMLSSSYWYFDSSEDNAEPYNYLYYEIYTDTVSYAVEASGENELFLTGYYGGIAPRYYFGPGKKLNPYLFAGLSITYLDVHFEDHEFKAYVDLGREDESNANPAGQWHDYSTDLGFFGGVGAEYAVLDYLGLFLQARYHFVFLGEYDFAEQPSYSDFHSLELHLGARLSFIKSKDL